MSVLYPRKFSVTLSGEDGKGIDLANFSCTFRVRQWELQTPGTADLRVLNLSKTTALKAGKEFTRLVLQAGYDGQYGTIFDGTIVQARRGRTSPVDTYLDLTAFDADIAHNFAVVNTTLAAGAKPSDIHGALCTAMDPYGIKAGFTDALPGPALPRGRVLYGMARDHLRDLADATGTVWSIQAGKVVFVARTGYLPGEAVVLTSQTGLIGLPQQTQDGIMVRSLLNPMLRVNGRIKIDNGSLQAPRLEPTWAGENQIASKLLPAADSDGVYRILALDHAGASRGTEWYTDITCISLDGTVPIPQAQRGRGGEAAAIAQPAVGIAPVLPGPPAAPAAAPAAPAKAGG